MSNGRAWPIQPVIGWRSASWWRGATDDERGGAEILPGALPVIVGPNAKAVR